MSPELTKVLIIDDNEDILYMLKAMLQMKHFDVTIKQNVDNLEEELTTLQPSVILMDMLLSGADGREVCKSLKENESFAAIPIIMISAHSHARGECLEAGANQFLAKPFDMQEIFEAVDIALANGEKNSLN
jgi:DNA-binding response OmpR family regulator